MKKLDLEGTRFGRLVVIDRCGSSKNGSVTWNCVCDCGNTTIASGPSMKAGLVESCGCLYKESRKTCNSKHGMSHSREYHSWMSMKQRCYNPKTDYYDCYGGRGIVVSERWRDSFEAFYEDLGDCPEGMSLERVDVHGNYEPSNCKWDTASNQGFNTRMHSNNTSGRTGVHWHKATQKWSAAIRAQGVSIHLGVFETFENAVKAREEAELKYYGRIKN